jgi:hypothetical protein
MELSRLLGPGQPRIGPRSIIPSIVNQVHDNLVSYSSSVPEAAMAPPSPLPQTLEELATKQQEDHDDVVATLTSLFNENQSS